MMDVAKCIHRSVAAVGQRRAKWGIRMVPNPKSKSRPYTKAEDKLLGTMLDDLLAKQFNRTIFAIQPRRISFGIAKFSIPIRTVLDDFPNPKPAIRIRSDRRSYSDRDRFGLLHVHADPVVRLRWRGLEEER